MDGLIGEIRLFAFNRIPQNWLACNGQTLQINTYKALFSLISTTYGGDGKSTFMVPNMNGRVIRGSTNDLGKMGGTETVTLTADNIPSHIHYVYCDQDKATAPSANSGIPAQITPATSTSSTPAPNLYQASGTPTLVPMDPSSIGTVGAGAPHENRQPYLAVCYCICAVGLYPMRG